MLPKPVKNIVVLTGAGISAESGITTFRDNNGLWKNYKVQDVATPEAFRKNPKKVFEFYNLRKKQLLETSTKPNGAHLALAKLEQRFSGEFNLITQNVDNLHELAGSIKTIHMHGELFKMRCQKSNLIFESPMLWNELTVCPCCNKIGKLRPHIVWFGEIPLELDRIGEILKKCDLFIAIGTSGMVYPAAHFVSEARRFGAFTININTEDSENEIYFHKILKGQASLETEKLVKEILGQGF